MNHTDKQNGPLLIAVIDGTNARLAYSSDHSPYVDLPQTLQYAGFENIGCETKHTETYPT